MGQGTCSLKFDAQEFLKNIFKNSKKYVNRNPHTLFDHKILKHGVKKKNTMKFFKNIP